MALRTCTCPLLAAQACQTTDNAAHKHIGASQPVNAAGTPNSPAGHRLTASQVNDWVTLLAGALTAVYTVLKIIEWFDARAARTEEQRTLRALWAKLDRMRSQPAPLDDQAHHDGK